MNDETKFWEDLKSGHFVSMVKESSVGKHIYDASEVYNIMKPMFAENDDVENMYCIYLTCKNKILSIEKMFSGSISSSVIYPREIIKRIITLKSAAIIIVHNHPSGDPGPSAADKAITMQLGLILKSIEVTLHDHIIVGDGYYSMSDEGFMKLISSKFENFLTMNI
jgi:DNA repair protein RadC